MEGWLAGQLARKGRTVPSYAAPLAIRDVLDRAAIRPVTFSTSDGRQYLITSHDGAYSASATGSYARLIAQRLDAQQQAAAHAYYAS